MTQKQTKAPKSAKLTIRPRRIFSDEFKRLKVAQLVAGQLSIGQFCKLWQVSTATVYRWIYRYSPQHKQGTIMISQQDSEAAKTKLLLQQVAQLEQTLGQKQMIIDFQNKLIEHASRELGVDLKKTFGRIGGPTAVLEHFRTQIACHDFTMNDLYAYCGLSKQAHYQSLNRQQEQVLVEQAVVDLVLEMRQIHPVMGLRTIYECCQPDSLGRDAFLRIGMRYGLGTLTPPKGSRTTFASPFSRYPNLLPKLVLTNVNQLWTSDITYFDIQGQFYYIVFILDVYSRLIVGYWVADNMRADSNVSALAMGLKKRGQTQFNQDLIHHSDRGGQYISDRYVAALRAALIRISMCSEVYENSHIERVNGTIKNQYLIHWPARTEADLWVNMHRAVKVYNTQRPHSSLGGRTPQAYESWLETLPADSRPLMPIWTYQTSPSTSYHQLSIAF